MKINTDGVLLGAMAEADSPVAILDIGTGTGVIALMLAQRYITAKIDAVELDETAAQTAGENFKKSRFADRLVQYPLGFEDFFSLYADKQYDMIISNPPFYINSLKSLGGKKTLAKHADVNFFESLVTAIAKHLTAVGCCWLILPVDIADIVSTLAKSSNLTPQVIIQVYSYPHSKAHRVILCLSFNQISPAMSKFIIYEAVGVYSSEYRDLLQPYFLAF